MEVNDNSDIVMKYFTIAVSIQVDRYKLVGN